MNEIKKRENILYTRAELCWKNKQRKNPDGSKRKAKTQKNLFFINKEIKDLKNYQVFDNRELETKAESET